MPRRKEKKEISVAAPAFKHKEEELLRDTTGVEELDVLKFSRRLGKSLSGLLIAVGALLFLFSAYSILTSQQLAFPKPLFIAALGFLGAINAFFGLILLAKE